MKEASKPLVNILAIFADIDERIMFLHHCSSDDFLSLNRNLKENYKKSSFITKQASGIFEKIGVEGNLKTLGLLRENFELFQQELLEFENETDQTLASMERIQANFSLMFVPINNFRQNLTSLKLLLSNIKLTNTYFDKSIKSFNESDAIQIESIINKVKDSCPVFEENIFNIQKHIKKLYNELSEVKTRILSDILKNFEFMQGDIDIIEKHSKNALKKKNRLEEITQNCKKSVGTIITNLQYHDIIRQKMEHIQKTHKYLIEEINNGDTHDNIQSTSGSYMLQIPQISEIQVGQLMHANKKYHQAIEQITRKMIEIGKDMAELVRICRMINGLDNNGMSIETGSFNEKFRSFAHHSKKSLDKYVNLTDEITLVNRIVTNLYHKYQDIDMMESAIEQRIIDRINFGDLLVSPERETASQAQQILKLYADNHFEKNKIKTLFESTQVELKEFICRNMDYVGDRKGIERMNACIGDAIEYFETIKENLSCIEGLQAELAGHSEELNENNRDVIEKVKYYDFFELTIDQLIQRYDQIRMILKNKSLESIGKNGDRKSSLKQIEKYYTMKSERMIHNQSLMNSPKERGPTFAIEETINDSIHDEGNDVEFF